MSELEAAWRWRETTGVLRDSLELGAVRVFHGPGEGTGILRSWSIDLFGSRHEWHAWVTHWEERASPGRQGAGPEARRSGSEFKVRATREQIREFLATKQAAGVLSAVVLHRPAQGVPADPEVLFGQPPEGRFAVSEGRAKFWIQLQGAKHPGLFLDHAPLRRWLIARARGWSCLNTFAYTGSLSIAAALGGAAHVTSLDLSKATLQWAAENWHLNGLSDALGSFVAGDVFEWLPRYKREKKAFDCVILDPPSFSRGKKGSFSTARDLRDLHALALDLLAPGGILITSINSANVSRRDFEADVTAAAHSRKLEFEILSDISLPETFPTRLGAPGDRYLKGWILKRK